MSDDRSAPATQRRRRLLAVSHPAVVNVNQEVYRELQRRGWEVTIVVPSRWRSEYSQRTMTPRPLVGLEDTLRPTPVVLAGHPQRHFYLTRGGALCARVRPDVAFVEAEPYAISATQWGEIFARKGIPFGVQCAENIDRALPLPVRGLRARVLRRAAFVAARSDSAGRLARAWGASGEVGLAPHAVPEWKLAPPAGEVEYPHSASPIHPAREDGHPFKPEDGHPFKPEDGHPFKPEDGHPFKPEAGHPYAHETAHPFTIGYAGRLVASKGLTDLLAAVRMLDAPVELLLIGDGELRAHLEGQPIPGSRVRVLDGFTHDGMASAYAQLDVLALPSRTTPTWKEQFGRVVVEALWCGVPVVGSNSGEIPWLIELTGGGLTFPEGDRAQLAARLSELRASPELRRRLTRSGRAAVERLFSVPAAADAFERLLMGALQSKR
jgi:glycosyltransferase involved in cell wall biosynthesis